jgi:PAS domain S-box-containing protein
LESLFDESKFSFTNLIDSVSDAVIIVNTRGMIIRVNNQVRTLFHYSEEELIGKPVEFLLPLNLRDIHVKYREMFTGHPVKRPMGTFLSLKALDKNKQLIPVDVSLNPITNNGKLM